MNTFSFSEEEELETPRTTNTDKPSRRRLARAPPDARWDPSALPSDEDDDEPRWTELQLAARKGNPERVSEILSRYTDAAERARIVNAPPEGWYSQTALQAACMLEHEHVVKLLLDAGADIGAPGGNNIYRNAFEYACGTGNMTLVRLLLNAGATPYINRDPVTRYQGRTPIQAAAESGSLPLVSLLVSLGADINAPASPSGGLTALQAASYEGHVELVQHLLANGADVNAAAARHGGLTALQGACRAGEEEVVRVLLAAGADVNATGDGRSGGTALHAAAEGGHAGIVKGLMAAGADCNVRVGRAGMRGQTAVQSAYVMGHTEVVDVLLERGATGSLYGGKRIYRHVATRSWSGEAMAADVVEERGRSASATRHRASSPNPLARRTGYEIAEYSKLGQRTT